MRVSAELAVLGAWSLCTDDERDRGRYFYRDASGVIRSMAWEHRLEPPRVAGVVAALSPNNSWRRNLRATEAILRGREDEAQTNYTGDLLKALHILNGADVEATLRGPKTVAFYRLLRDGGNDYDVCVDGHVANLVRGEHRPLKGIHLSLGDFNLIANAVRQAARRICVQPCQLQAALWLAWRASDGFRQKRLPC